MKRLLTLLSWMLLLQTSVSAQHDGIIWNYEHLSRNDGLSGNRVTALCDDMYGRIWIGTSQGLNIYDGRRLQKVEEYNGLEVWSFHDAGDRILIGTTLFLGVYDYASGRFSRLTYEGRDVGYVRTIVQAGNDLLLKTPKQLFRCDGDRLTRVAEDTPYEYFCCDKFGQMWGLFKERVFRIGEDFKVAATYDLTSADRSPLVGVSLYADSKGCVWVGTIKDGLFRYNRAADEFRREPIARQFHVPEIENIAGMNEDRYDRLWIGHNNGVSVYDYNNDSFCNYVCEHNDNAILNTVICIFRTRRQDMLLGTYFSGLFRVGNLDSGVEYYTLGTSGPSLRTRNVAANGIQRDAQGNWWVSTNSAGINVLDPSGSFLRRISSRNAEINDNILSLQRDVRGNLWAGSLASGLYCLAPDGRIRQYTNHAGDTASISSGNILLLCPLNADTLFVATEKGIDIYRYATDSFESVCKRGKEEFAFYDAQIHGDKVWFINFCSVLCYDRRQRRIEEFQVPETETRPYMQCGWVDGGCCLWLGTTKGDVWRFEEGRFTPAVQNHPQINGGIAGMRGDAAGNLWLAAGNDLFRLDTAGVLRRFSLAKGMGINEFNVRSGYVGREGEICFGTTNGLVCFWPAKLESDLRQQPTLFISGLKLFNKPVEIGGDVLKFPVNDTHEITLAHKQTFLTFEVSVIDYDIFRTAPYSCRYRLENFDDNWYELGPQGEITYTGLPTGRYGLSVRLVSDDGEVLAEKRIALRVRPPVLLSGWMIALYALVLGLVVWQFVRLVRRQRHARALVEQARRERETRNRLNAMKLDLFSCISYEFKTPLSVISTLQDSVLPPSDGDAGSDPAIFRRNIERLDFLVNQLLDFRNIESRNISVSIRKYDLVPFLSNIYETFVPLYNRKQITHSFHSDVESLPMLFDAAKMEMLLGNLLGNSFKSVQPGGESTLKLSFDGRQAVIELFNSGSCLTEEQRQAIFQPYNSAGLPNSGIGLALVKSVARLFDIRLSVEPVPQRGNVFRVEMAVGQDDGAEPERPDAATGIVERIVDNTSYFEDVSQPRFLDAEGHRKFRILLVENDADSKRVLEKRLQKHFHVSSAATGDEALLLLKSQSIDVVISDMQLADTNGFDLCGMIKNSNRTRHIPVILESFELSGENRIRALQCGADAMFQKPINLQELFLRLSNLLRTKDVLRDYYMTAGHVGITTPELNNTDERFILSMTDYIHAHLDDPALSVNELARYANISRTQLYLSIKRLTDRTPSEFILQIKMREAAKWLQTTAMTASEISYKLGYCNPNHFSRQFKEYYGASPGEYRRRQAKSGA